MSEIAEDFLKMIHIAVIIIGILGLFFLLIQYNIILSYSYSRKEVVTFGDSLLAYSCLAVEENGIIVKSLFDETKINNYDPLTTTCIKYKSGVVKITINDEELKTIIFSTITKDASADFNIAIKRTDGTVVPAKMTVTI